MRINTSLRCRIRSLLSWGLIRLLDPCPAQECRTTGACPWGPERRLPAALPRNASTASAPSPPRGLAVRAMAPGRTPMAGTQLWPIAVLFDSPLLQLEMRRRNLQVRVGVAVLARQQLLHCGPGRGAVGGTLQDILDRSLPSCSCFLPPQSSQSSQSSLRPPCGRPTFSHKLPSLPLPSCFPSPLPSPPPPQSSLTLPRPPPPPAPPPPPPPRFHSSPLSLPPRPLPLPAPPPPPPPLPLTLLPPPPPLPLPHPLPLPSLTPPVPSSSPYPPPFPHPPLPLPLLPPPGTSPLPFPFPSLSSSPSPLPLPLPLSAPSPSPSPPSHSSPSPSPSPSPSHTFPLLPPPPPPPSSPSSPPPPPPPRPCPPPLPLPPPPPPPPAPPPLPPPPPPPPRPVRSIPIHSTVQSIAAPCTAAAAPRGPGDPRPADSGQPAHVQRRIARPPGSVQRAKSLLKGRCGQQLEPQPHGAGAPYFRLATPSASRGSVGAGASGPS